MRKRTFCLLYLTIVILAVLVRLFALGKYPPGIYWDEAAILADAKKVAATGTDLHGLSPWHLIYPSYGDYKLAPYIWAVTACVRIFGVNYFSLRLPSCLAGVLTVVLAGALAKIFAGKRSLRLSQIWQLSVMFITALAPWSILFSRTGFEGHLAQALLTLAAYLLVLSWQPPKFRQIKPLYFQIILLLCSGFIGGLAFWTYFSVRFVWPFVASLICLYFFAQSRNWRQLVASFASTAVIFCLMLIPMTHDPLYAVSNQLRLSTPSILNNPDLPHQVNAQRLAAGNNLPARLIFNQKLSQAWQLASNYSRHFHPAYLFLTGDANLRHSTGFTGLFYLCCAPLLILGAVYLWRRDQMLFCLLFGWWIIGLLPASVPTLSVPHALRSLNSLTPACIIIGYGLTVWLQFIFTAKFPPAKAKMYKISLITLTAVIFAYSFTSSAWYYVCVYPTLAASAWEPSNDHLVQILIGESQHYKQVYAIGLDRFLYLWHINHPMFDAHRLGHEDISENYVFHSLNNVYYDTDTVVPSEGQLFFLGKTADIEKFLSTLPHRDRQDLYRFTEYGVSYLGVSVYVQPPSK